MLTVSHTSGSVRGINEPTRAIVHSGYPSKATSPSLLFFALLLMSSDAGACPPGHTPVPMPGGGYVCQSPVEHVYGSGRPMARWLTPARFLMADASRSGARNGALAANNSARIEIERKDCESTTSMPVVIASGAKYLAELDFVAGASEPLILSRTYHSGNPAASSFGSKWSSSIDYGLVFEHGALSCASVLSAGTACNTSHVGLTKVTLQRPGGMRIDLAKNPEGEWTGSND